MNMPNNTKITWIDLEKTLAYILGEVTIHNYTHTFQYSFHPQHISKEDMLIMAEQRIKSIKQFLKDHPEAQFLVINGQNVCNLDT